MNVVTVKELRDFFEMALNHLTRCKAKEYEFEFDSYWTITHNEWLEFNKVPDPSVGSLSDDILYLREGLSDSDNFSFIDFDKIASVLKAISEIEAPSIDRDKPIGSIRYFGEVPD